MTNDTEIVHAAPAAIELQGVDTIALKEQLRSAIGMTETAIVTVATIWRELTRRGEDMSEFRMSLSRFLMPVAEGRLLPRLVVQMSGQTRSLDRLSELPVPVQESLVDGEEIDVYRGDGRVDRVRLGAMTYSDIALAIRDGRILSADEQRLAHERSQRTRRKVDRRGRPVHISLTDDNRLVVGKASVDVERVIAILRANGLLNGA